MKKSLLVASLLVLTLAACGKKAEEAKSADTITPPPATETPAQHPAPDATAPAVAPAPATEPAPTTEDTSKKQ
ncbi:MAG: hypothetical protein IT497_00435 [Ottowia sp.]|jgi:uncharacterized lipoprotein|nr:hypothetical protein [Ottowia sp.]